MNREKAIKFLAKWHKDLQHDKLPNYHDALKLGIEALDAINEMCVTGFIGEDYLLPSETKEIK